MILASTFGVASRAGKAKNRKWKSKERFSMGHGAGAAAFFDEKDLIIMPTHRAPERGRVQTWRRSDNEQ